MNTETPAGGEEPGQEPAEGTKLPEWVMGAGVAERIAASQLKAFGQFGGLSQSMQDRIKAAASIAALPTSRFEPPAPLTPLAIPQNPTIKVAQHTAAMADDIQEMVAIVGASLTVSQELRDTAIEATNASKRSGRHALIVAYVSAAAAIGALVVSAIALAASSLR